MLVYTMLRAPLELRLFVLYAGLTFAAVVAWPGTPDGATLWWDLLLPASNGNRYFLLPVIAFLFTCTWLAASKAVPARAVGVILLAISLAFGVRLNWREPPHRDFEFAVRWLAPVESDAECERDGERITPTAQAGTAFDAASHVQSEKKRDHRRK